MIRIAQDLEKRLSEAIQAAQVDGTLPGFELPDLKITRAAKLEMGDFTTPAAMHLAKLARMKLSSTHRQTLNPRSSG